MLFSRILRYFSISSLDFRPEEPFLSVFLIKRLFFCHPLWSLQATLLLIGGEKDFLFPIAVESLLMSSSGPGSLLEVTRKLNGNWFIYVPWHYFCEFIYFLMTDVYIFFLSPTSMYFLIVLMWIFLCCFDFLMDQKIAFKDIQKGTHEQFTFCSQPETWDRQ